MRLPASITKFNVWAACLIALLVCSPTVANAKDKGKVASLIADELKKLPKDSFKMYDVVVQFKFTPSDSVLNAITKFGGKTQEEEQPQHHGADDSSEGGYRPPRGQSGGTVRFDEPQD